MKTQLPTLALAFLFLSFTADSIAANRTWSGGAPLSGNWSLAANWSGGVAPSAGDNLIFPAGASRMTNNNNYAASTAFGSITFSGAGYVVTGNDLRLTNDFSATHLFGRTIFLPEIILSNDIAISQSGSTFASLVLSNLTVTNADLVITGTGNTIVDGSIYSVFGTPEIYKRGNGRLTMNGFSYSSVRKITVEDGTLWFNSHGNDVDVLTNATFGGDGFVDRLRVLGGTVQPGTNDIGRLRAYSVSATASSTFRFRINTRSSISEYDELTVLDSLDLGGADLVLDFLNAPIVGDSYELIWGLGGATVTNHWAGLAEGALFTTNSMQFQVTYRGGYSNNSTVVTALKQFATGVTSVWDGGGTNSYWSTPENWVGDVAPNAGDDLEFPIGAAQLDAYNDFVDGVTFNSITFSGTNYDIHGRDLGLIDGITVSEAGDYNTVVPSVFLRESQTWRASDVGAKLVAFTYVELDTNVLTITGPGTTRLSFILKGSGNIIKNGNGTLELRADSEDYYSGTVIVNAGTLETGSQHGSIVVNTNATLSGYGSIRELTSHRGIIHPGTDSPYQIRFATATFDSGTKVRFRLDRTSYSDSLRQFTNGPMTLGSAQLQLVFETPPVIGDSYTLIQCSNAPALGTFAGLPEGALFATNGAQFQITYRGGSFSNDVVITMVKALATGITRIWDGGATNENWMSMSNWVGDLRPNIGDDLLFPPAAARPISSNDFPAGMAFNSIRFAGSNYLLHGNSLSLIAGVTNVPFIGTNVISCPLTLETNQTYLLGVNARLELRGDIDLNSSVLVFNGNGVGAVSGSITNSGALLKAGPGVLALNGSNSYSGGTIVSNGTLVVANSFALGFTAFGSTVLTGAVLTLQSNLAIPEPITLFGTVQSPAGSNTITGVVSLMRSNSAINVFPGAEIGFEGTLIGPGGFLKLGGGLAVIRGAGPVNSFVAPVAVLDGTLFLGKAGGTAISGDLYIGDGLGLDSVRLIAPDQVANAAHVIVFESGRFELQGFSDAIAGLEMHGGLVTSSTGTLNLLGDVVSFSSSNSAIIDGKLDLGGAPFRTFSIADGPATNDMIVRAHISSSGAGLTKTGPGKIIFAGTNSFAGDTAMNLGTMIVNGEQTNSRVFLAGGVLGGFGAVGQIIGSGGILSPGESPGVFTTGELSLNPATAVRVELNGATPGSGYDRIRARGLVNLNSSPLVFTATYFPSNSTDQFPIIENDGADAVVGTFATLTNGAVFTNGSVMFRINYDGGDGNDVVLKRYTLPSRFTSIVSSPTNSVLSGSGEANLNYTIQGSTDLTNWVNVGTSSADTSGLYEYIDTDTALYPYRFYRAVSP